MNFKRFTLPDGSTDCFVNLDQVIAAKPSGDGKMTLYTPSMSMEVDAKQFEQAVGRTGAEEQLPSLVVRLTQALDRLSVRIPSSIRLHM